MSQDTIYALSTAFAKSAIAIIRVSGEKALESLKIITTNKVAIPRKATLANIYDLNGEILDKGVFIYFEKGSSYTGEDLIEYHVHGSISVIKDILNVLSQLPKHRLADRGEFTKRALENSRLDVLQAESINDLINSQTSQQRRLSVRGITGDISNKYNKWHTELKELLAVYEASIDFSDQELPDSIMKDASHKLDLLFIEMEKEVQLGKKIKKLKEGISIAIIGSPNVGKSSLINYLTTRDTSIVSNIAGTTRDIVEAFVDISGFPVSIADTAGLRSTSDEIEQEGIRRATKKAQECDVVIAMLDASNLEYSYSAVIPFLGENNILLINKIDLNPQANFQEAHKISIKNNIGLKEFDEILLKKLEELTSIYENPIVLQQRHAEILTECLKELKLAKNIADDIVLISFHVRNSLNQIGRILGKIDIEEILGLIFSNFCIGK